MRIFPVYYYKSIAGDVTRNDCEGPTDIMHRITQELLQCFTCGCSIFTFPTREIKHSLRVQCIIIYYCKYLCVLYT